MVKFKVGDSVEMIEDDPEGNTDIRKGKKGKVVLSKLSKKGFVGIQFRGLISGWNLDGTLKNSAVNGWLVPATVLKLVPQKKAAIPKKKK